MADDLLDQKRRLFENFAESFLRSYIDFLKTEGKKRSPKVFNDPIWHSIQLHPLEILILDSPLLQRLRRIRQLGVVHWIYPGAEHTRLQHSIGVVHQAAQIIASINASSLSWPVSPTECISKQQIKVLRMAALCHDVGQGVMSHVSENAVNDEYEVVSFKNAFSDKYGLEQPKLTEIVAYYIIGSPAFKELIGLARNISSDTDLPEDAVDSIKKIIVGLAFCNNIPQLQEIISGPFDADKLDYMNRDAFMSGVPIVVDIPRLVQKIRAVNLPPTELPQKVASKVTKGYANYTLFGVDLSGGRTLDELMLGRTLLFDKIYRHQKVRAAEAMVSSLLTCLLKLSIKDAILMPFQFTDEELIGLDEPNVIHMLGREPNPEERIQIDIACDLARRLRDRRIFARCFAFTQSMPSDAYSQSDEQKNGITKLFNEIADVDKRLALRKTLAEQTEKILDRLNIKEILNKIPGGRLVS
jgi:hypothetical protein